MKAVDLQRTAPSSRRVACEALKWLAALALLASAFLPALPDNRPRDSAFDIFLESWQETGGTEARIATLAWLYQCSLGILLALAGRRGSVGTARQLRVFLCVATPVIGGLAGFLFIAAPEQFESGPRFGALFIVLSVAGLVTARVYIRDGRGWTAACASLIACLWFGAVAAIQDVTWRYGLYVGMVSSAVLAVVTLLEWGEHRPEDALSIDSAPASD